MKVLIRYFYFAVLISFYSLLGCVELEVKSEIPDVPPIILNHSCETSAVEDEEYSCRANFTDLNTEEEHLWSLLEGNTCNWLSIDVSSGEISGVPNDDSVKKCLLEFTVTDEMSLSAISAKVLVEVTNIKPTLEIADAAPIDEGSLATVVRADEDVQASDEGFGVYSLIAAEGIQCGANGEVEIDSEKGSVTYAPAPGFTGNCNINVQFDDQNPENNLVNSEFSVEVTPVNDVPVISFTCDDTIMVGATFSCSPTFVDSDSGDTHTWSLVSSNTCLWAEINPTSGLITGSPAEEFVGSCNLAFQIQDQFGGRDSESTTVTVTPGVTPLEIELHQVSAITENSARVQWSLNRVAQGYIEYGKTIDYGAETTRELSFRYSSHVQSISNLDSGTVYHYKIRSTDEGGQTASAEGSFTTAGTPPVDPLVFNFARTENITETSVGIRWGLNRVAQGYIEYGTTTGYGSETPREMSFRYSEHLQTISGLSPGTTYYYKIHSADENGVTATSEGNFSTSVAVQTARCEPTFENLVNQVDVKQMWPMPSSITLPSVVGSSIEWQHPRGLGPGVKITLVTSANDYPGSTSQLIRTNEYAMHSPFSAEGRYLVTHGTSRRALFDGLNNYSFIRIVTVPGGGLMYDWQWNPARPHIAYYFNQPGDKVMEYNALSNEHRVIYTAGPLTMSDSGVTYSGVHLGSSGSSFRFPMAGSGSISANGNFLAFKMHDGTNGYVVRLNTSSGEITHALRVANAGVNPQNGQANGIDHVQISPDGENVIFGLKGNGIYGTNFGQGKDNTQVRAYPLTDFRVARGDSSVLLQEMSGHDDTGARSDGSTVYLNVKGTSVDLSGNKTTLLPRWIWPRNSSGSQLTPAAHVGAADGAPYAILSAYAGGHAGTSNEVFMSNLPTFGYSLDTPNRVAWLGWTNVSSARNGYTTPKAAFTTNALYSNGKRGWKWAFTSDNRTGEQRGASSAVGHLYAGELICP